MKISERRKSSVSPKTIAHNHCLYLGVANYSKELYCNCSTLSRTTTDLTRNSYQNYEPNYFLIGRSGLTKKDDRLPVSVRSCHGNLKVELLGKGVR
ncbi:hypothetical protein CEXT_316691 [Caerostris extrusa]|uniref:Uncharacterized protein n=1 Tax=Caerostris extrusa TaxID=172846 RepID=A0AAV4QUB7_CAEEX|nr:hypothetical protein CEXT_316691 [Caerostris extrusa]